MWWDFYSVVIVASVAKVEITAGQVEVILRYCPTFHVALLSVQVVF